jgi:hypothetical protein
LWKIFEKQKIKLTLIMKLEKQADENSVNKNILLNKNKNQPLFS